MQRASSIHTGALRRWATAWLFVAEAVLMRMRSWGFWQSLWRMWGETQARTITPLFCSTHTPHPVCQNMLSVGPVAAADWEIRAASWQLAAMLEASSNKRICEGKRKKEKEKKWTLSYPFDTQNPNWATKLIQRWSLQTHSIKSSLKEYF